MRSIEVPSEAGGDSAAGTLSGCITGSDVTLTESLERSESTSSKKIGGGFTTENRIFMVLVNAHVEGGKSWTTETSKSVVIETTIEEDSSTMFHLEDPDGGDYFVVSVWSDPDYGTALFSVDGGASHCQWEVGTAHRSSLTMAWEYLGDPELPVRADEAALFRVTLGNTINYHEAGTTSKDRPGWTGDDRGYVGPNLVFATSPTTVGDGILVRLNGVTVNQQYSEFGKGTIDKLVTISRGPMKYGCLLSLCLCLSLALSLHRPHHVGAIAL